MPSLSSPWNAGQARTIIMVRLSCLDHVRNRHKPSTGAGHCPSRPPQDLVLVRSANHPEAGPALSAKIFRLTCRANQRHNSTRLTHRGALAIATDVRCDAMDARAATDVCGSNVRRSRVVRAPRCWRQVSRLRIDPVDRARSRGATEAQPVSEEHEVSRKAIARGVNCAEKPS